MGLKNEMLKERFGGVESVKVLRVLGGWLKGTIWLRL